jgi:hypothetical protein
MPEHFDRLFLHACAGMALFLVGGTNLLLLGRGLLVRAIATLAVFSVVLVSALALPVSGIIQSASIILAIGLGITLLPGWPAFVRVTTILFTALQRPAIRFGLMTACGIGLVVWGIASFERSDELAKAIQEEELNVLIGSCPTLPSEHKASTDRGTDIVMKTPADSRSEASLELPEAKFLKDSHLDSEVIRRAPADPRTNCHGWVFTGGRFMLSPDDVELILEENGYTEVQEPHPGDLVVYRHGGAVAHTAIIRYVAEGQPVMVESKWGQMGVFLHPADKCSYGPDYTFHRSPRNGHLLAGLGGSPASTSSPASFAATE